ncbi:MAG: toxin-activating lysine-acyltransferase [Xanthobacteraceae bacterium]
MAHPALRHERAIIGAVASMMVFEESFASATSRDPLSGDDIERVAITLPLTAADELRITSGVFYLSRHSSLHSLYPVETLHSRIGSALPLGQFHYYTDPLGVPVAFCNWAWLNRSVLDDVLATGRDLEADEFRCGDLPLFYEFLAPFGHCRAVVRDFRRLSLFKSQRIPSIRAKADDTSHAPRVRYLQF